MSSASQSAPADLYDGLLGMVAADLPTVRKPPVDLGPIGKFVSHFALKTPFTSGEPTSKDLPDRSVQSVDTYAGQIRLAANISQDRYPEIDSGPVVVRGVPVFPRYASGQLVYEIVFPAPLEDNQYCRLDIATRVDWIAVSHPNLYPSDCWQVKPGDASNVHGGVAGVQAAVSLGTPELIFDHSESLITDPYHFQIDNPLLFGEVWLWPREDRMSVTFTASIMAYTELPPNGGQPDTAVANLNCLGAANGMEFGTNGGVPFTVSELDVMVWSFDASQL